MSCSILLGLCPRLCSAITSGARDSKAISAEPLISRSRVVDQFNPVPANKSRAYQPPAVLHAFAKELR